jgi:hypothetical protein
MRKIKLIQISIIILVSIFTSPLHAGNNGIDSIYYKDRVGVGIKPKTPLTESLTINGSMMILDGNQGLNRLLKTDANGLASWVPATYFPGLVGNGTSFNNLIVSNGYFQDLYLNGTTIINGKIRVPGTPNGYILTMQSNGNAHWSPNYGSNDTSNDPLWQESFNTLLPKNNNGEVSIAIGDDNTTSAEIVLHKNGGAQFNRGQANTEDFNVGTNKTFFAIKVETDDDQVGIRMGSPDTRLDVLGMFGLRADGTDYAVTPDNQSSVYWVAQNSSLGNNGDVLARISALSQDKVFKLVDFLGTTNGVKTQNGITLTDLTANRLVASDSNKAIISETGIIVGAGGIIGFANSNPGASLELADSSIDFVDGVNDLSIEGDIEADGTIYAANFVGDTIGLYFNGVTIRHAKIYTSTIFKYLDFNGNSYINAADAPLYLDANMEFKGNSTYQTGNKFELLGAPGPVDKISFHVFNGRVGINTTSPAAEFDLNGTLAIRDGTQGDGYLYRAVNATGLGQWEYVDTTNVSYAVNAGNATTANFTDAIINGTITDSDFINGLINGTTLVNVDLTGIDGAADWIEGVDGLYPKDGATENVLVGGTTLASSTISMESNGTLRAVKFIGDFTGVPNVFYNQEWNDQGSYLHPFDLAGAKGILVGGNTVATADTVFNADGSVTVNEQAQNSDTRFEGQSEVFLFHTDASSNRVSVRTDNPRAGFEVNGSLAFAAKTSSIAAATGIPATDIQNNRVIYLESSGACSVDLNAVPQIAAGADGQIITLIGRYNDETIKLDDGDGLALANNVSHTLKAKDSITLMYSSGLAEWIEISRTNYVERTGDSYDRGTCI